MTSLRAALLGLCFTGVCVVAHAQLKIGQSVGVTGAVAATVKESSLGAQLYIDAVNAKGGINGEKSNSSRWMTSSTPSSHKPMPRS